MSKFKLGDRVFSPSHGVGLVVGIFNNDHAFPISVWFNNKGYHMPYGANGEYYGTGASGSTFDLTLDLNYMVNQMWEEYDNV
jgi:hypothetical protein